MASIASALIIVNTRDVTPPVTFKIVRKELILSPEARLSSIAEINVWIVRHQRFWFQRPRKLGEYLTHLVDSIMRRVCGVASAGFQVFCV